MRRKQRKGGGKQLQGMIDSIGGRRTKVYTGGSIEKARKRTTSEQQGGSGT